MKIYTRDKEAGNVIEICSSVAEAEAKIKEYEKQDKLEGTYSEDFYEIYIEE